MIYFWVPLCALHSGSLVSLVFAMMHVKNSVCVCVCVCDAVLYSPCIPYNEFI